MTPSTVVTYMNGVENFRGTNFAKWKADLNLILAIMDRGHSFGENKPIELVVEGDNDSTLAARITEAQWERSDMMALIIMDHTINPAIRGALPKTPSSANEFMAKIEEHFQGSSKVKARMLMTKMMNAKYTGQGSVREYIMKLIDMSNKSKDLDMPLPEPYLDLLFFKQHVQNRKQVQATSSWSQPMAPLPSSPSSQPATPPPPCPSHLFPFPSSPGGELPMAGTWSSKSDYGRPPWKASTKLSFLCGTTKMDVHDLSIAISASILPEINSNPWILQHFIFKRNLDFISHSNFNYPGLLSHPYICLGAPPSCIPISISP
jgi:hypothetical protein